MVHWVFCVIRMKCLRSKKKLFFRLPPAPYLRRCTTFWDGQGTHFHSESKCDCGVGGIFHEVVSKFLPLRKTFTSKLNAMSVHTHDIMKVNRCYYTHSYRNFKGCVQLVRIVDFVPHILTLFYNHPSFVKHVVVQNFSQFPFNVHRITIETF